MAINTFTEHYAYPRSGKLNINSTQKNKNKNATWRVHPLNLLNYMLYGDIQVDNAKDGITSTTFNLPGRAMVSIQTGEEESLILGNWVSWKSNFLCEVFHFHRWSLEVIWEVTETFQILLCYSIPTAPSRTTQNTSLHWGRRETQRICPLVETEWKSGLFLLLF